MRDARIEPGVKRVHCIHQASAKNTTTLTTKTRTAPLMASLARQRART
jgi:hypothetical protein